MINYIEHVIGRVDNCPNCGLDFNDKDILQTFLDMGHDCDKALKYAMVYGWDFDNQICFRKEIGIETNDYDGISFYRCPECGSWWRRFEWSNPELNNCEE